MSKGISISGNGYVITCKRDQNDFYVLVNVEIQKVFTAPDPEIAKSRALDYMEQLAKLLGVRDEDNE